MDEDPTGYGRRPQPVPHCVALLPKKRGTATPQLSADVCCGQTAGWIKMPLAMVVGLGPGDIMLDGDPAPLPQKGHSVPQFFAHVYLAKRLDG